MGKVMALKEMLAAVDEFQTPDIMPIFPNKKRRSE